VVELLFFNKFQKRGSLLLYSELGCLTTKTIYKNLFYLNTFSGQILHFYGLDCKLKNIILPHAAFRAKL